VVWECDEHHDYQTLRLDLGQRLEPEVNRNGGSASKNLCLLKTKDILKWENRNKRADKLIL
jgi:hypothetical protein